MSDLPRAYEVDGVVYIRASALGGCVRALWAALTGVSPTGVTDDLQRIFDEGHLHEEAIKQELLADRGIEVTGDQDEVTLWIIPGKLAVVGHIDGRIRIAGKNLIFEAKSMSRTSFDSWVKDRFDARPTYAYQISTYIYGDGADGAYYVAKRRDDGLLDIKVFDEAPIPLQDIKAKAMALYKAYKRGAMPDCDLPPNKRYPCDYWFLHEEQEDGEMPPDSLPDDIAEADEALNLLAGELMEIRSLEKEMRDRKKEIQEQMEQFRFGRKRFRTDKYGFTVSVDKTRTQTDLTKMKIDGIKVENYQTPSKPWNEWKVKEVGE